MTIFLHPTVREYPVDGPCADLVKLLEDRHFAVEGVEVTFDTYSNHKGSYRNVDKIIVPTLDFTAKFGRSQGFIDTNRYNCAAISELKMPQQILTLYSDHSGPSFYVYVGHNWEREKQEFFDGWHVHPKMNKEPRTYLRYTGSASKTERYTYEHTIRTYLLHDSDLGRQYDLLPGDKEHYVVEEVCQDYASYIERRVMPYIKIAGATHSEEETMELIEDYWIGYANKRNQQALAMKLQVFLSIGACTLYDGRTSRSAETLRSVETSDDYITINDTYGSWNIKADGKTALHFSGDTLLVDFQASGIDHHWVITNGLPYGE